MARMTYSRRQLLKLLAAFPATIGLARRLAAEGTPAPPPRRLILCMQNNGTQQANFWPAAADLRSPILDGLLTTTTGADNGLRGKTTLVKGVYIPNDANGTDGNAHDMGFARMFTGAPLVSAGGQPWGGAASVDQMVAQSWGIDTLTLAVLASQVEPHPKPGFDHRESFSYLAPATIKHPRRDPLQVFRYLFDPVDHAARRLSVLDAVAGNLREIEARLGPGERAKLDHHLTAIGDVQARLHASYQACSARPSARPTDYNALDPGAEVDVDTYIPALVDDMLDLIVVALQCGMTRIATMQFGYGGGKWKFAWKGIDLDCHGQVAHLDTSDAGSSALNNQRLVLMNQYYASCVARLATRLDAVPEGDGTMLDHTLIVWANEQGRGDHNQENVPIVLVGRAGGAIPPGGRVVDVGRQPFQRVGCTVLNAMGIPAAGFGDLPDCGPFAGL